MERSQGDRNCKKGQKRTAFEFATEFHEQSKEYAQGLQANKKLLLFEDRHILMKGIAQQQNHSGGTLFQGRSLVHMQEYRM